MGAQEGRNNRSVEGGWRLGRRARWLEGLRSGLEGGQIAESKKDQTNESRLGECQEGRQQQGGGWGRRVGRLIGLELFKMPISIKSDGFKK